MTPDKIAEIWTATSGRPFTQGSLADVFARAIIAQARAELIAEIADKIDKSADETNSLIGFATRRNVASEVRALAHTKENHE